MENGSFNGILKIISYTSSTLLSFEHLLSSSEEDSLIKKKTKCWYVVCGYVDKTENEFTFLKMYTVTGYLKM